MIPGTKLCSSCRTNVAKIFDVPEESDSTPSDDPVSEAAMESSFKEEVNKSLVSLGVSP